MQAGPDKRALLKKGKAGKRKPGSRTRSDKEGKVT